MIFDVGDFIIFQRVLVKVNRIDVKKGDMLDGQGYGIGWVDHPNGRFPSKLNFIDTWWVNNYGAEYEVLKDCHFQYIADSIRADHVDNFTFNKVKAFLREATVWHFTRNGYDFRTGIVYPTTTELCEEIPF